MQKVYAIDSENHTKLNVLIVIHTTDATKLSYLRGLWWAHPFSLVTTSLNLLIATDQYWEYGLTYFGPFWTYKVVQHPSPLKLVSYHCFSSQSYVQFIFISFLLFCSSPIPSVSGSFSLSLPSMTVVSRCYYLCCCPC